MEEYLKVGSTKHI